MIEDRTQLPAPWPNVGECFSDWKPDHTCGQCDGSHEHEWVAWRAAPNARYGVPVRCRSCGGRKCDAPSCLLRRHHRGGHEHY